MSIAALVYLPALAQAEEESILNNATVVSEIFYGSDHSEENIDLYVRNMIKEGFKCEVAWPDGASDLTEFMVDFGS